MHALPTHFVVNVITVLNMMVPIICANGACSAQMRVCAGGRARVRACVRACVCVCGYNKEHKEHSNMNYKEAKTTTSKQE
jgi:hypothetical protein